MIAQTYCGISYHDTRGEVRDCDAADGPCPACLRAHIAKLETRNAELRAKLEALRRTNFAEPFEGWIGLATELLDALEAALARAEGTLPELTECDSRKEAESTALRKEDDFFLYADGILHGYRLAVERLSARSLPAAPEPRP